MINTIKENFNRALYALIFSIITIGTLSFLSFETPYGLFLAGSFGSSMVLLFGYPESPFAQPKNVFFGHLVTSIVGILIFFNCSKFSSKKNSAFETKYEIFSIGTCITHLESKLTEA